MPPSLPVAGALLLLFFVFENKNNFKIVIHIIHGFYLPTCYSI